MLFFISLTLIDTRVLVFVISLFVSNLYVLFHVVCWDGMKMVERGGIVLRIDGGERVKVEGWEGVRGEKGWREG